MARIAAHVLYEDNHLLVLDKPAGLPTMGVNRSDESLFSLAKDYIKERYQKPGNVYLGIVSRLDAPVSGAIVLARTSKAARRLTEQFRQRDVLKLYWALVEGLPSPSEGTWTDWLRKDERQKRMAVASERHPDAKECRLSYRVMDAMPKVSHVEIRLDTGRKHQIRVQFASRGHAVLGDRKYGARTPFRQSIALHSRVIEFLHPVRKERLRFVSDLPGAWQNFGDFHD